MSAGHVQGAPDAVYGVHAVEALLAADPGRVHRLRIAADTRNARVRRLIEMARRHGIRVERDERRWLDQRYGGVHQGVVAECDAVALADEADLNARLAGIDHAPLLLILDGVLDPRNLGACLRSAGAAGVDAVLLPKRRTAPLTAAARKAASGAVERLHLIAVSNLARRLEALKRSGIWLVGTSSDAELGWTDVDMTAPTAIVVGGEGKGMRALTRRHCDHLVALPMRGGVASLNVSVAAGILLFEAVRQRLAPASPAP